MDLTTLRSSARDRKWALRRNAVFVGVSLFSFLTLLVAGLPLPSAEAMARLTRRISVDQTLSLRQDTEMPPCDGRSAVNGVRGLLRARSVRVIGLSDIHDFGPMTATDRVCRAVVNLDFSSQPVFYTIRRLRAGQPTWELSVLTY